MLKDTGAHLGARLPMSHGVDARIETHVAHFGAPAPGVGMRLRAMHGPGGWRVFASALEGPVPPVVAWIERMSPVEIQVDATRLVTAYFASLPPALAYLREPTVNEATIDGEGRVCLFANGTRDGVHGLLDWLKESGCDPHVRHLAPPHPQRRLLTPGQETAVRAAAEAGYYRVPRAITLQALAASIRVSPASLSERLRRAEARLVEQYVREHGRSGDPPRPDDVRAR